jgi:hypothetical protein
MAKVTLQAAIKKVKKTGYDLRDLDETFRDNEEVVLAAIENDMYAFGFASDRLKDDEKFFLKALKVRRGDVIQFASERIRNDKKCATKAVKSSWTSYNLIGDDLKADRELLELALDSNSNIFSNDTPLETCAAIFKSDKEIVKKAIKNWAFALRCASDELRGDRELVMIAVSDIGGALEYASDNLKNDKEIVLKAVSLDPDALEFASEKMKKDKDVLRVIQVS